MSRKTIIFLMMSACASISCLALKAGTAPQIKPDKMPTVIVYAVNAIDPEKKAADELRTYLMKILGIIIKD